ncbi:MAG: DUF4258 domain-containing protein [Chitinophagaceae bacterium]|nr:DUF4258 domain-containing protein [Chitinophagaceae bacterium]
MTFRKNKNKNYKLILIICLIVALIFSKWYNNKSLDHDTFLNRHPTKLFFTKHAKCRMRCRFFSEKEVKEILAKGKIDKQRSHPNDKPCPTFAIEGITSDNQHTRMVFANCGDELVKVITVIDLENSPSCDCN